MRGEDERTQKWMMTLIKSIQVYLQQQQQKT